jgi:hypothetical protein
LLFSAVSGLLDAPGGVKPDFGKKSELIGSHSHRKYNIYSSAYIVFGQITIFMNLASFEIITRTHRIQNGKCTYYA